MKTLRFTSVRLRASFFAALSLSTLNSHPLFAQGSLTPPGAPAPTMKTLDQVEARTPLDVTHTPGDATNELIVTQPGSYYLTSNLGTAKTNGIHVMAEGVTIDLNGFQVARIFASFGAGILIDATSLRCTVKNGSISGFGLGIQCASSTRGGSYLHLAVSGCTSGGLVAGEGWRFDGCVAHDNAGIGLQGQSGSVFFNCVARNNQSIGIQTGSHCTLTNCTATLNQNTGISTGSSCTLANCTGSLNVGTFIAGIATGNGCTLINCTAEANTASSGFSTGFGCSLSNCTANDNTSAESSSFGIRGARVTISHCTVYNNTSTAAAASGVTGGGISASFGSTITDCTVQNNKGDGILVGSDSNISRNNCSGNGNNGDGAGIHTTASHNAIESNNVTGNDRGIEVTANASLVIKNNASNNGPTNNLNYVIAASNRYGPIINVTASGSAAVTGNSAASTVNSTDPWANFAY